MRQIQPPLQGGLSSQQSACRLTPAKLLAFSSAPSEDCNPLLRHPGTAALRPARGLVEHLACRRRSRARQVRPRAPESSPAGRVGRECGAVRVRGVTQRITKTYPLAARLCAAAGWVRFDEAQISRAGRLALGGPATADPCALQLAGDTEAAEQEITLATPLCDASNLRGTVGRQ